MGNKVYMLRDVISYFLQIRISSIKRQINMRPLIMHHDTLSITDYKWAHLH